jgi:predicted Zn-dependent peptidase
VLFDTFANAHDGYGAFEDLQAATVTDCADFFERYYTPDNAVLTLAGDFDSQRALDLVDHHFGDVPHRPAPERPSFAEPWPTTQRESDRTDPHAPVPALAVGWRLPDPVSELPAYLPFIVLGSVLSDGESSRLQSELVAKAHLATDIWATPGLMGGPLDSRDPDVFVLGAIHPPQVAWSELLTAADAQIAAVAAEGPTEVECARAATRFIAALYRDNDGIGSRVRSLGALELLLGRAELLSELPALLGAVTPAQVATAAAALTPNSRAVLRVNPAGRA